MSKKALLNNITNKAPVEEKDVSLEDPNSSAVYSGPLTDEKQALLNDSTVPPFELLPTDHWEDIDARDMGNPYTVSCYANEVYNYLTDLQHRLRPSPSYILHQSITPKYRSLSIDWIIELHKLLSQRYQTSLQADTLFISVSLLDRFLSKKSISLDKLNLVALGCFFIAAKFEETYYPSVEQLLAFTPELGRKEDLLKMERIILNELRYMIGCPTPLTFLKRYAKAADADSMIGMIARFLAEYSMMNYRIATFYLPSQIAAAAISHALRIVGRPPWSATLQHYSSYSYSDLLPLLKEMKLWVKKAPYLRTQAAFTKYAQQKYLKASLYAVSRI